ncbi:MAG: flavodoxin family protein [Lachnospiraceae bacterium]|nr:flavodoxin family protein [Lachnospiraceae bacterium]
MGKAVLIYASTHHGNTKKVVDAIANEFEIETVDATKIHEKDLTEYDLIGFASGIFYSRFSAQVLEIAKNCLPDQKNVFYIATAGNPRKGNFNSIAEIAAGKQCNELGRFQCRGFDTYGPFKLVGGIQKGHPDEDELKDAVDFYKMISETKKV